MAITSYQTKKGKRYRVIIYLGQNKGNRHTKGGFKTKKEAKLYEDRYHYQLATGMLKTPTNKLFKEVYETWLPAYEKTVEKTTYARTSDLFRLHILEAFGKRKINEITPLECQEQIIAWSDKFKNIKQLKSYTSQIFEFAINMNLIEKNPMQRIIMPKVPKNRSQNFWTVSELHRFLNILAESEPFKHLALFRLLAYSGMRKGELYALKWPDIDFDNHIVHITKNLAHINNIPIEKKTKNQFSIRSIKLDEATMKILKQWKNLQARQIFDPQVIQLKMLDEYCFTYIKNNGDIAPLHSDYINNILNKITKNYGLKKISPHGFGYTHATLLTEIGIDPINTANRLGHASAKETLDTYGHVTIQAENESITKFADYLNKNQA